MEVNVQKETTTFVRLRKLMEKESRYESHSYFLSTCLERRVTPKGFRLQWSLGLDSTEEERNRVEDILETSSQNLLQEALRVCDRQLHQVQISRQQTFTILKLRSEDAAFKQTKVHPVSKDGNCFFRCVARSILENEERHEEVRKTVVDHMVEHKGIYVEMIDGDFDEHTRMMRQVDGRTTSWATEAEITATANCYGIDIYVENVTGNHCEELKFPLLTGSELAIRYMCVRLENNHFNLLVSKPRPRSCTNSQVPSPDAEQDTIHQGNKNGLKKNTRIKQALSSQSKNFDNRTKTVTNLSRRQLSKAEISLLSKGLKFVPTRKNIDKGKLIADLKTWERRMRLREFFYDEESGEYDDTQEMDKRRKQSSWTPIAGRDKWLDTYIQNVKDDVISGLRRNFKMNITKQEERAMKDLLKDHSIVIRPADKGSGIVVMDSDKYVDQMEKELRDNETYSEVKEDKTKTVENKVKKLVNDMYKRGSITKHMKSYLIPTGGSTGKIQGNPKLHKKQMPLRTIVNGRNHPTENMAEVVEDELRHHATSLPSYIQDTTDFLKKIDQLPQPLPAGTILFCLDVKALYPSVPRQEARVAAESALNSRRNKKIPTEEVLRMMDMVLENNTMSFAGKHFVQKEGTAIGSHLGMNYASTYLGSWESTLLERSPLTPFAYFRYVDDVWGLWSHGEAELLSFHKLANTIHPRIQVEMRFSTTSVEFLDVLTTLDEGTLHTNLHTKPTDQHMYLHQQSSHPETTKKAIPYGLGVRVKRICTDEQDYTKHRETIKQQLEKRGYDGNFVERELKKVDSKSRTDLLKYKGSREKLTRIPLAVTYSKALPNIGKILQKHLPVLHTSDRMKLIFTEAPILAYRRDKNLQDILVHKKHNNQFFTESSGSRPCGKKCAICPYVVETETFTDYRGTQYRVKNSINCKSTNVVYAIFCKQCDKYMYVGETGDTLYQRHLLNLSRIRTHYDDPVAEHFNTEEHTVADLSIVGLEKLNGDTIYRRTIECLWKAKLRTYRPYGLNTKE